MWLRYLAMQEAAAAAAVGQHARLQLYTGSCQLSAPVMRQQDLRACQKHCLRPLRGQTQQQSLSLLAAAAAAAAASTRHREQQQQRLQAPQKISRQQPALLLLLLPRWPPASWKHATGAS